MKPRPRLDSVIPAKTGIEPFSIGAPRESGDFLCRKNAVDRRCGKKAMDPRLRGDDRFSGMTVFWDDRFSGMTGLEPYPVIPAKAGIQPGGIVSAREYQGSPLAQG